MKELKRIVNEETWKTDRKWDCPYCRHKNPLKTWMNIEECEKCHRSQKFDSDYENAYEGDIFIRYVKPLPN